MQCSEPSGVLATYQDGQLLLDSPINWPDGARVRLQISPDSQPAFLAKGHVIIAGFGLCGRCVAELLDKSEVPYVIIERNPDTVETQRSLGRRVLKGDVTNAATLTQAGLGNASILALTVPDEDAVLEATALARRIHPGVYIIARTTYASKGMQALQLGADEVIKAEQAVAFQFYERLRNVLSGGSSHEERSDASAASGVGKTSNH
ncbi:MAG: NAD-binding protein [Phycisphaerae bacterium]|nr:NAD-binding protein [Phycisphaerae bacterium]